MAARFDGPAAPINATDPVKATRAQMAREIKLTEMATGRVTPPDWHREKDPDARSTPAIKSFWPPPGATAAKRAEGPPCESLG